MDYIVALTNLYGIVHKEKVCEIYNMQNKEQIEISEIKDIMRENEEKLSEQFTYIYGDHFVHEAIITFDECELYLEQKAGKPYYIPSKRELLKYTDSEYFEKTKEYYRLFKFVKKHLRSKSVNSVEDICMEVVTHCQMDNRPADIINDFNRLGVGFDTQEQLSEAVNLIMNLANNTRLWVNNGYTPSELFSKSERSVLKSNRDPIERVNHERENDIIRPNIKSEKVGRNDQCPCGSGKKYKRCCL